MLPPPGRCCPQVSQSPTPRPVAAFLQLGVDLLEHSILPEPHLPFSLQPLFGGRWLPPISGLLFDAPHFQFPSSGLERRRSSSFLQSGHHSRRLYSSFRCNTAASRVSIANSRVMSSLRHNPTYYCSHSTQSHCCAKLSHYSFLFCSSFAISFLTVAAHLLLRLPNSLTVCLP